MLFKNSAKSSIPFKFLYSSLRFSSISFSTSASLILHDLFFNSSMFATLSTDSLESYSACKKVRYPPSFLIASIMSLISYLDLILSINDKNESISAVVFGFIPISLDKYKASYTLRLLLFAYSTIFCTDVSPMPRLGTLIILNNASVSFLLTASLR